MRDRWLGLLLVGSLAFPSMLGCNGSSDGPNGAAYTAQQRALAGNLPQGATSPGSTSAPKGGGTAPSTSGSTTTPGGSTTPGGTTPPATTGGGATNFVYVANATDSISTFAADPSTGALTAQADVATPAGFGPFWLAVDPTGSILFCSGIGGQTPAGAVLPLSIASGVLTPGAPVNTASVQPFGLAVDPVSEFVYTADFNNFTPPASSTATPPGGTISAFSYATGTGALTAGTPASATGGPAPSAIVVDPQGANVFVALAAAAAIQVIPLQNGALNAPSGGLSGLQMSPQHQCNSLAIDKAGATLYVGNADDTISVFDFSSITSASTPPTQTDVNVHATPLANQAFVSALAIDSTGKFLVSANGGTAASPQGGTDDVSMFTISPSHGALTLVQTTPAVATSTPSGAIFNSGLGVCYVTNSGTATVSAYNVTSTGIVEMTGSPFALPSGDQGPMGIAVSK
jgi:6-phosphogluconolactonase (cycloisomerase 2 family)